MGGNTLDISHNISHVRYVQANYSKFVTQTTTVVERIKLSIIPLLAYAYIRLLIQVPFGVQKLFSKALSYMAVGI